jgi:SAM-dependent methyltransferase
MKLLDWRTPYRRLVQALRQQHPADLAMQLAVGGDFENFGLLECALLQHCGLQRDDYLIDVGCGSGRLAKPLSAYLLGRYLGTDIVPELLAHAHSLVHRPDWRFELTQGTHIPEDEGVADMVCFFSVFTHLLHEHSFVYLREARRVLKPGGKIVISFLEFAIPRHWEVFEWNVSHLHGEHPLTMFLGRDAIAAWARHLDLRIEAVYDGDKPHFPIPGRVMLESGLVMDGHGYLGQSVAVLVKH